MKKSSLLTATLAMALWIVLMGFNYPQLPQDFRLGKIIGFFQKYIQKYHQNKVYIQTDRNVYKTGETIYFKAYVINTAENRPEETVKNLYVEMISPDKGIFMTRLLKIENGLAQGDFPVLDTVRTGMYMMRAYTNNMKNSGNDYLFTKEIRINHPSKVFYSKEFHRKAKKITRQEDEMDLQFFPEGGELVDNIKSTVAFKAINQNGLGVDVKGKILSGKDTYVCDFETDHLGMGKFEFTPVFKTKYYATTTNTKGKEVKTELPEVIQIGYVLNITDTYRTFDVSIKTNKKFSGDPVAKTVYLIAQSGGKIYSSGEHMFENNTIEFKIAKSIFPTGVIHFTLFDGIGQPQCERLAFVNKKDGLLLDASLEKKQYSKRDKIGFDLEVSDQDNNPIEANFSIAVREKSDFGTGNPNIQSYLLLQSDIKGKIEDVSHYFSNDDNASKDADLLMLTQGWRKFLWKDILKDSIPDPEFSVEKDITLTGRITKYYLNIPVKNADITLTLLNKFNDVFKTKSGKKGYYEFTGMDYTDTMDVLMEVRTQFNRKNVLINVDENKDIDNKFYPFKGFYLDSLNKKQKIEYKKLPPEEDDPSKPKDYKLHDYADNVVKFNDQMRGSGQGVMDILKSRVPGLTVGQNGSSIRGPSSIMMSNDPLYLIDGVPVDYTAVQSLNTNDVESVEVLKGPSAAIYGMQGANGVIAVYTKKGFYMKRGEFHFKMLGYHTPKKFYSPKYTNNTASDIPDERRTIFWAPSVKTNANGLAHVEFYHSDIPGDFEVVIEGMDNNGTPGRYTTSYTVQ